MHCQKYAVILYTHETITLYSLYSYSIISLERKRQGEKGKSIIQTNNHANLKRYSKPLVAAKEKKKSHTTPPVCYLSSVYQGRGHGRGRIPVAGKLIYLVYKVMYTAALNYRGSSDPSLMSASNRGGKREEKEGGEEGGRTARKGRREGEKRWREERGRFSWEASLSAVFPTYLQACTYSYLLWGCCALWGTYLREHVLLPSYMAKKLSCFHTSPCQP